MDWMAAACACAFAWWLCRVFGGGEEDEGEDDDDDDDEKRMEQ